MTRVMSHQRATKSGNGIRVFVAESDTMAGQLIDAGLKRYRTGFQIQAVATDSDGAIRQLLESEPDVAVISSDLQDGPLTGFKLLHELRDSGFKCPIIILLNSIDRELAIDAIRGGARGVFPRTDPIDALAKCICAVQQGQIWINNQVLEFLLDAITRIKPFRIADDSNFISLTSREQEITRLVGEGLKNGEIARKLRIAEHTVTNYLARVFEKLGVSSRVELVLYTHSR